MKKQLAFVLTASILAVPAFAADKHEHSHEAEGPVCTDFGPQTPRDIDSPKGENKVAFTKARGYADMNLCNLHFHKNAEHKAKNYSIHAEGEHGADGGYQCNISKKLSVAEMAPTANPICKGEHGELKPGDTIEVHWVHTSCDVKPGKGLGSCLTDTCKDPELRVEAQVFTLVNDPKALDFNTLNYDGKVVNGHHQANAIPNNTGKPVEFLGSTTGPQWTDQKCSPMHVTWSVRPQCAKVDISSVGKWCQKNAFAEDHAHGVRKLVANPKLLSPIK